MATLVVGLLVLVPVLAIYLWWRLFNTPDGERYLQQRLQGPFVPPDSDAAPHGDAGELSQDIPEKHAIRTDEAQTAVFAWLALADTQAYAASWEHASDLFTRAINLSEWEERMLATRAPLAAVQSRNLQSATCTKSLPGVPDGEYVVLQFKTQFEHKANATETVTTQQGDDGTWRVAGYFIK